MAQIPLLRGQLETATDSNDWPRIGLTRDPSPNLIWIPLDPNIGTDGRIVMDVLGDSICGAHS
jgi:hypothetical protein